jgi:deazaflavin-dependent oxidoreductase (nitroreductase family)
MRIRNDRSAPFLRVLARFNRKFANPVVRLVAGRLPPLAIIRHRGRRTGRAFATPVLAFGTADGLVVGVLYGDVSDWVRNVRVAGGAQVKRGGVLRDYRHLRLVSRDEGLQLVPVLLRGPFRALGVRYFLELTAMSPHDRPG